MPFGHIEIFFAKHIDIIDEAYLSLAALNPILFVANLSRLSHDLLSLKNIALTSSCFTKTQIIAIVI